RAAGGMRGVDHHVADAARAAGARLVALETAEEQVAALAGLDPRIVTHLIAAGAELDRHAEDMTETLVSLYLRRDIGMLMPFYSHTLGAARHGVDLKAFLDPLINERNRVMHRRAKPLVEAGGTFVAVGALHLVGDTGLVEAF